MTMANIGVRGVSYHIDDRGAGRPLLLLHGLTGQAATWHEHYGPLTQHFRVIAVDLLGHGHTSIPTDPARYRIEEAAADIISVLQHLNALPTALLGYSMGGRLGLFTALAYPHAFSTLILESASPGIRVAEERAERVRKDAALAEGILEHGVQAFVDAWEQLPMFDTQRSMPEDHKALQRSIRLANDPVGLANSLRGMGVGEQPSLWDRLSELQMPVLLLTGSEDRKFTELAREMQAAIPNARHKIIAGASHTVHVEQPHQYDEAVIKFLLE
jgi:2-succinyl-6-hydroxy-2,4-cyclohexadiene-1-carboxylate synthase